MINFTCGATDKFAVECRSIQGTGKFLEMCFCFWVAGDQYGDLEREVYVSDVIGEITALRYNFDVLKDVTLPNQSAEKLFENQKNSIFNESEYFIQQEIAAVNLVKPAVSSFDGFFAFYNNIGGQFIFTYSRYGDNPKSVQIEASDYLNAINCTIKKLSGIFQQEPSIRGDLRD
jgi:hypothetical protein